jgi:antitoxin ParD1/3/4
MAKIAKRTFSLPPEQAAYIDAKVDAGAYASGSEVVRAGLRALQEHDAAVERRRSKEVAPAYDTMKPNSKSPACSAAQAVWSQIRMSVYRTAAAALPKLLSTCPPTPRLMQ